MRSPSICSRRQNAPTRYTHVFAAGPLDRPDRAVPSSVSQVPSAGGNGEFSLTLERAVAPAARGIYALLCAGGVAIQALALVWIGRNGGWDRPEFAVALLALIPACILGMALFSRWAMAGPPGLRIRVDAGGVWADRPGEPATGFAWAERRFDLRFTEPAPTAGDPDRSPWVRVGGLGLPRSLELPASVLGAVRDSAGAHGLTVETFYEAPRGRRRRQMHLVTRIHRPPG